MVTNRFDVFLISLDPTRGSEIRKTRPCLIISPDEMNDHIRTVIVAPMTEEKPGARTKPSQNGPSTSLSVWKSAGGPATLPMQRYRTTSTLTTSVSTKRTPILPSGRTAVDR
jgi:hypothetical protein